MRKIICITICMLFALFTLASCSEGSTDLPSGAEGVDLSRYEKPKTAFLYDGHTLTDYEKMIKVVVEEGEYLFDSRLDGIGYQLMLEEGTNYSIYAFYCVDIIKVARVEVNRKTSYITYVKLEDTKEDTFNIMYKITYQSYKDDFYAIMINDKKTFDGTIAGTIDLYRGDISANRDETIEKMRKDGNVLLTLMNNFMKTKELNLSCLGFTLYN